MRLKTLIKKLKKVRKELGDVEETVVVTLGCCDMCRVQYSIEDVRVFYGGQSGFTVHIVVPEAR